MALLRGTELLPARSVLERRWMLRLACWGRAAGAAVLAAMLWGCSNRPAVEDEGADPLRTGPPGAFLKEREKAQDAKPVEPAAPVQKAQTLGDTLFPRVLETTWELERTVAGEKERLVMRVTAVAEEEELSTFAIETERDGKVVQSEGYVVDTTGVYRATSGQYGAARIEPRMPVLPADARAGASWNWSGAFVEGENTVAASARFRLLPVEKVVTKAGPFEAYRLEQVITIGGGSAPTRNTMWLAPGVGMVKQVTDDGITRVEAELVKFKPGGKSEASTPAGAAEGAVPATGAPETRGGRP